MEQLKNLNRQLRIQDVLSVLMTQSTKLIEIVNANQKEVNRLKEELDELKKTRIKEKMNRLLRYEPL